MGALVAGVLVARRKSAEKATLSPAASLWALTLQTPAGASLPLLALKGKPLLINFWATWCAPCIEEMELLNRFYRQNKGRYLQLLGIAADKPEAVSLFLAKKRIHFPIVLAGFDGISLSQSLGNTLGGLPFTVLLSAENVVLFAKSGQLTANDLRTITLLVEPASR